MKKDLLTLKKHLTMLGIVSTTLFLTSCDNIENVLTKDEETQQAELELDVNDNYNIIMEAYEEEKVFDVHEHYLSLAIDNGAVESLDVINNIPDGYEVYTIYPIIKTYSGSSGTSAYNNTHTAGYVLWFVNNEKVKVKLSNHNGERGYYNFGEVVDEKTLQK